MFQQSRESKEGEKLAFYMIERGEKKLLLSCQTTTVTSQLSSRACRRRRRSSTNDEKEKGDGGGGGEGSKAHMEPIREIGPLPAFLTLMNCMNVT